MPNAYKRQLVDENGDYIYPVVNEGDDKVPVDSTDITGYSGTILDLVKGIYPEGYHRWYTTTDDGASNITDRPTGTSGQGFVLEAFKCRDYNGSNNSKYRLVCRKSGDTSEWVAAMFTSDTSITWVQNIAATGGTLTGRLKWKDSNALQAFSGNPPYLIGMESFANGGETKYVSLDNARNAILSNGSVTTAKIADNAVTSAKLAASAVSKFGCKYIAGKTGTFTTSNVSLGNITLAAGTYILSVGGMIDFVSQTSTGAYIYARSASATGTVLVEGRAWSAGGTYSVNGTTVVTPTANTNYYLTVKADKANIKYTNAYITAIRIA